MAKQNKYTKSARGQDCQIRIPGVCNRDPATTVPAHLNGAGMGIKHPDIFIAYSCSDCHDFVDGRNRPDAIMMHLGWSITDVKLAHHEAVTRTQQIMIKNKVLVL